MPESSTPLPVVAIYVFLAGVLGIGTLMLTTGAGELLVALRSQGWPSVAGTIQTAETQYNVSRAGGGGSGDIPVPARHDPDSRFMLGSRGPYQRMAFAAPPRRIGRGRLYSY